MSVAMSDMCCIPILHSDVEIPHPLDCPEEVGHFSVANSEIRFDRPLVPYYVPRKKEYEYLDLNVGYEKHSEVLTTRRKSNSFDTVLYWLKHVKFRPLLDSSLDFVCSRGCIQVLLSAPYDNNFSINWSLVASRVNGVIYIARAHKSKEEEKPSAAGFTTDSSIECSTDFELEKEIRMTFWGYKFEDYMTSDTPEGVPKVSSTTQEQGSFIAIIQNRIGPYTLLIKAEMDAVKSFPGNGDTTRYVELKTSKIRNAHSYSFKKKMLEWWAQSVVTGIEDNICGFRDDSGIVHNIQVFKTSQMPHYAQSMWSPNVCYNFCHRTLEYLKKQLPENDKICYLLNYYSGQPVLHVSKLVRSDGKPALIPGWYVNQLKEQQIS